MSVATGACLMRASSLVMRYVAFARCAAHKVEFVSTIVDVFEDGTTTFDRLNSWRFEAAAAAKRFVGWT